MIHRCKSDILEPAMVSNEKLSTKMWHSRKMDGLGVLNPTYFLRLLRRPGHTRIAFSKDIISVPKEGPQIQKTI